MRHAWHQDHKRQGMQSSIGGHLRPAMHGPAPTELDRGVRHACLALGNSKFPGSRACRAHAAGCGSWAWAWPRARRLFAQSLMMIDDRFSAAGRPTAPWAPRVVVLITLTLASGLLGGAGVVLRDPSRSLRLGGSIGAYYSAPSVEKKNNYKTFRNGVLFKNFYKYHISSYDLFYH